MTEQLAISVSSTSDIIGQLPQELWTSERMQLFWEMVFYWIRLNMPIIMLLMGFMLAVITLAYIVYLFFPAKKEEKEDDEYDMRYY